jgi:hypothetical protein
MFVKFINYILKPKAAMRYNGFCSVLCKTNLMLKKDLKMKKPTLGTRYKSPLLGIIVLSSSLAFAGGGGANGAHVAGVAQARNASVAAAVASRQAANAAATAAATQTQAQSPSASP